MTTQRIQEALSALLSEQTVVFWHDVEGQFSPMLDGLQLDGVQLVRLDDTPTLRVKLDIERAPDKRWLIYSNKPEPEPTKDWLLDVRMRSKSFRADSTSILLEDLGLTTQGLRQHLKERSKFLRAKDRVERFKRLVLPGDGALDLDRKMLAVLTRADQPELFAMLQRLFGAMVFDGVADLSAQPKASQEIAANDLTPAFWALVALQLGYVEASPISDVQTITFDSSSQLLDERKRFILLTVLAGAHDPHKLYDLVMRDAVSKVEVLRLPIKVDLAFGNDF